MVGAPEASASVDSTSDDPNELLRANMKVKVTPATAATPLATTFRSALADRRACGESLLESIEHEFEFKEPTPVQMQVLPMLIDNSNPNDLVVVAPTGSGKTHAFLIPAVIRALEFNERVLIISPNDGLATQIASECVRLTRRVRPKKRLLVRTTIECERQASILIVPIRKLIKRVPKNIDLVVWDEIDAQFQSFGGAADRFKKVLKNLSGVESEKRTTKHVALSATLPAAIRSVLVDGALLGGRVVEEVSIGRNASSKNVKQSLMFVSDDFGKIEAMKRLVAEKKITPPALLFVDSKKRSEEVSKVLSEELSNIYPAGKIKSLHTDSQNAAQILEGFRKRDVWLLVTTDKACSRGMDFPFVSTVICVDFPDSTTSYVHRVGRTGRGGREGEAITFFTSADSTRVRPIANLAKQAGGDVPDFLLKLPKRKASAKRKSTRKWKRRRRG